MNLDRILSKLNAEPDSILDVGCGRGATTFLLQRKFPEKQIVSLDIELWRLKYIYDKGLNDTVICGSGTELPIRKERMDLVVCDQVIEHVEQEKALIQEIMRVLKPGGHLIIGSVMRRKLALSIYRGKNGEIALSPDHVREYRSVEEFADLFKDYVDSIQVYAFPVRYPLIITAVGVLGELGIVRDTPSLQRNLTAKHRLLTRLVMPRPGFSFIYLLGIRR